jgi:hypothetical protein
MRLHGWTRRGISVLAVGLGLALLGPAGAGATVFSFGGSEQQYDVPVGAKSIVVVATGAPGGSGDSGAVGGFGSSVRTTLPVTPGELLYVDVGVAGPGGAGATGGSPSGGAFGGGGADGGSVSSGSAAGGGAGGGASAIRTCSLNTFLCFLTPPLVTAAGGGGGGGGTNAGAGGAGDRAGAAANVTNGATAGSPGSATKGGKAGGGGTDGDFLVGGAGAPGSSSGGGFFYNGGGGGGGGGLFGGGGGGATSAVSGTLGGGGGGGGASAVSSGATGTTVATDATGVPQVVITPIPMAPSCAGNALYTLPGGSKLTVELHCTTPMGLPIVYSIAGGPVHGGLGVVSQPAGTVAYTPKPGYSGNDSFTFAAANSGGKSSPATVTITVPPAPASGKHCLVPKLKGSSLSGAKRKLAAAGCALGKVTRRKTHKHRRPLVVVRQGTPAGSQRGSGTKVSVTLG